MDAQEVMRRLQDPFLPEEIEWRVGSTNGDKTSGIALAYVTNRAIMNRLDELFGPFGWRNEFKEWKGTSQLCGISVKFEGEWITKWDGADDSQTEAVKGGLSDAMKRAGYQWGIGRYLYNLENQWVPIKAQGRSYTLASDPRLPQWALPAGYTYPNSGPAAATQRQETQQRQNNNATGAQTPTQGQQQRQQTNTSPPPEEAPASYERSSTPNSGQQSQQYIPGARSRVYKLKDQLGMDWPDLNNLASNILGREVKFLKSQVKTEEEWVQIEAALKEAV